RPPGARGIEGVATVTDCVGDGTEDRDGHGAAGVAGSGRIEVPDARAFDSFVGHAADGWLGRVNQGHSLAALGGVAAGIGRPPGARGIEGVATVTGDVGHGVEDGDGYAAASIGGGWRIKGPGTGAFDS